MKILIVLAAIMTPILGAVLASDASIAVRLIAILATLVPVGAWIALRRPLYLYSAFAFVLAAIPFGVLPGSPLPLVLLLSVAIGITTIIHLPRGGRRPGAVEWGVLALIIASAVSMVVTATTSYDYTEFAKWFLATSSVLSLSQLSRPDLRTVGRWYVVGAATGSVFGLITLFFDSSGRLLSLLSFLGYGVGDGTNLRYVVSAEGMTVRLTGTYVDPNAGGLFLYLGVLLALALFRGIPRVALVSVVALAMALTLSRAAILSLGVAFLVYIALQRLRFTGKVRIVSVAAVAGAVLLMIPAIQRRLFDSFGSFDTGSSARADALRDYPKHMDGSWLFGLGWGRIEFRDGRVGMAVNHVANAPLLSVYRGGLVVGILFCFVLIVGIVLSFRALRSKNPELGYIAAGYIGFVGVALQLDFPVITIPPVAALFAFFLAVLPREEDFHDPPAQPGATGRQLQIVEERR
ncbi:hypothetical protein LH407_10780 [Antiquaquibacter oligotrophicus]|uniref:O-antigen ligase family protein n=1 Tax=Antiquaquibacter oligotrophicus TaxID=2880260 RepID=UPI002AC9A496|nr:O-antigen ligase family protein [Antiquaquibacter oligotrophicus]UDF12634.1 hypothetical protein LH407_10780 [Antiquaquibacter oligotrophicus]